MMAVTFTSLVLSIKDRVVLLQNGSQNVSVLGIQIGIAALLFILGILVAISCSAKLLEKNSIVKQ